MGKMIKKCLEGPVARTYVRVTEKSISGRGVCKRLSSKLKNHGHS